MLKSLRVPEQLFAVAMWIISVAFASFLIGLGGRLIADLPSVDDRPTPEMFMAPGATRAATLRRDSLLTLQREASESRDRASLLSQAASTAYDNERAAFRNWIATRVATVDATQDPEVVRRTRALDTLGARVRAAEGEVNRLDREALDLSQRLDATARDDAAREAAVEGRFQQALFAWELRVFGLRLLLTLPLLVLAGWLVAKKRKSDYWPLHRGFVLFALFAFFVELVPYLPSYGGYVRYGVGIVLTAIVARYAIRAMRRYLATRKAVEAQSETERRRALGFETALKRMAGHVCPACERPIAGAPANPSCFCVFCGLKLFDKCGNCGTSKNAFYQFCPSCGVVTDANEGADTGAGVVVAAGPPR